MIVVSDLLPILFSSSRFFFLVFFSHSLFPFSFQYGDPSTVFYDTSNGCDIQELFNKMETIGKVTCTTPLVRRVTNPYTCLVLGKGKYTCRRRPTSKISKTMILEYPFKICGQGIGETILDGFGLKIEGSKGKGSVVIEDLTIQGAKNSALYVYNGMNLIVRRCKVEKCQKHGVVAHCADVSCEDIQVVGCRGSGVRAYYGCTVKLSGKNTRIAYQKGTGHVGLALWQD